MKLVDVKEGRQKERAWIWELRKAVPFQLRCSQFPACGAEDLFMRRIDCATTSYFPFSLASVGNREFAPGSRAKISSRYCSMVKYRCSCRAA